MRRLIWSFFALIWLCSNSRGTEIYKSEDTDMIPENYGDGLETSSSFEPSFEIDRDSERMGYLQEFIRYMVDDVVFPIEGIVKGYCLYRSVLDESREGSSFLRLNKESIAVATILLSGSWKNPLGFVSRCRGELRRVSNGVIASNSELFGESWSSFRRSRRSIMASRTKICFKARICSRMMKKLDGMEDLRKFLLSRTKYGVAFPSQSAEVAIWNTVRELKDVLSAGLLKGEIQNYTRVLLMSNYINKLLQQVGREPASLFVCIALINAMVREKSLNDWLPNVSSLSLSRDEYIAHHSPPVDPVTGVIYDFRLTVRENVSMFKISTCNHVLWSSGLIFTSRHIQAIGGEDSQHVSFAKKKIFWMCTKMFSP